MKVFLIFLMALVPAMGQAYDIERSGICYNITADDQVAVAQNTTPYSGFVSIPDSIEADGRRYGVTAIADKAFNLCDGLTSVALPSTLLSIGSSAFAGCTSLSYITLPPSVQTIGDAAFSGCTQMRSVTLPAKVTRVGCQAFAKCSQLARFEVEETNVAYAAEDGILMSRDLTHVVAFPPAKDHVAALPPTTRQIDSCAFAYCDKLTDITLPEGVAVVEAAAFYQCSALARVSLPSTLERIGMYAFAECPLLAQVTVPRSTSFVGDGAFGFCESLQNIFVQGDNASFCAPDGVLESRDQRTIVAFPAGRGGNYRIPATVDSIANQAFYGCHLLESVTLPAHLADIGDNPFIFCDNLKDIFVDNANTAFQSLEGVLLNADKTAIVAMPKAKQGAYAVPEGVTAIEGGTFLNSAGITSLTLPTTLESIAPYAFVGCYGLASVNLPQSLASLGQQAFDDCTSLTQIICAGVPPIYNIIASQETAATPSEGSLNQPFASETYAQATLFVPKGSLADYKTATPWNLFDNTREYGIYADDQQANRYAWQRIPVGILQSLPITALQADLTLPEGFEMATDSQGNPIVELYGDHALTHRATLTPLSLAAQQWPATRYHLSVVDAQNRPLVASDTLLFMALRSPRDSQAGAYGVQLEDITLTYATETSVGETQQKDLEAAVNLQTYRGDVNRNGRVNVADAVETIRYTLGTPTERFHFDEADVNSNGAVNVADAMQTIDLIQQNACSFDISPLEWGDDHSAAQPVSGKCQLAIASEQLAIGTTMPIRITLESDIKNLTAHQFVLRLPQGIDLEQDEATGNYRVEKSMRYADNGQIVAVGQQAAQGVYSIVSASMGNNALLPGSGALLTLYVHVADDVAEGNHVATLERIVLADTEGCEIFLDDARFGVFVTTVAGINSPVMESIDNPDIYNLQGQKVNRPATRSQMAPGIYIVNGKKVVIK